MHLRTSIAVLLLGVALSGVGAQWFGFGEPAPAPPANAGDKPLPSTDSQVGDVILHKLRGEGNQAFIAVFALAVGAMMLCGTEQLLKLCLIIICGIVSGIAGMNQVGAVWSLAESSIVARVAGLEIGLIAAYISYLGYDGVLAAFAAFLGFAVAWKSKDLLDKVHLTLLDPTASDSSHTGVLLYYSIWTLGAMRFFRKNAHLRVLGMGCSIIGGALFASGFSWAITFIGVHNYPNQVQANGLTPVLAPWTDFFYLLISSHSPDVGLFAGSRYNEGLGGMLADRLFGQVMWALLSLFGIFVQWEKYGWDESAGEYMSSKTVLTEQLLSKK